MALPFETGYGPVLVAPRRRGWRYLVPERGGCEICVVLSARRAARDGRAAGVGEAVTPSDGIATGALLAPLPGGASLLGWTDAPRLGGPPARSEVRRVR